MRKFKIDYRQMVSCFCTGMIIFSLGLIYHEIKGQVTGKWRTVSEYGWSGKINVEIYEHNGKLFGRVIQLLPSATNTVCENCRGDMKNKPITGMVLYPEGFGAHPQWS